MYRPYDDLARVQCRLGKLLLAKTVDLMFSQPENRFTFQEMMKTGKVFVANLAGVETGVCAFLLSAGVVLHGNRQQQSRMCNKKLSAHGT
jgi:hypothetical protein